MHTFKNLQISNYVAPFWLKQGDLNTIVSALWPLPKIQLGNQVDVTFADGERTTGFVVDRKSEWVVLFLHGLAGSAESSFVLWGLKAAEKKGWSAVAINHRNCGSALGLATKPYNSGKGEDASDYVHWIRQNFPGRKILAVGYSLGASMLLNLMTHRFGTELPDAAVAVNSPLNLSESVRLLCRGSGQIYGQHFTNSLRKQIQELIDLGKVPPQHSIPKGANLRHVDEIFTAPLSGFRSADHYYETASVGQHLDRIDRETLFIGSMDDPFIPYSSFIPEIRKQKVITSHFFSHGGHVGYWTGRSPWFLTLLEDVFAHFNS